MAKNKKAPKETKAKASTKSKKPQKSKAKKTNAQENKKLDNIFKATIEKIISEETKNIDEYSLGSDEIKELTPIISPDNKNIPENAKYLNQKLSELTLATTKNDLTINDIDITKEEIKRNAQILESISKNNTSTDIPPLEKFITEGEKYTSQNNHKYCVRLYTEGLRHYKEEPTLLMRRAVSYLALESFTNAIDDLSLLISIVDPHPEIYFLRSIAYDKLSNINEAITDINKSISMRSMIEDGDEFEYFEHRLSIFIQLKRYDDALDDANELIKIKKNKDAYLYRAKLFLTLKSYENSINDFNEVINIDPQDPISHEQRLITYIEWVLDLADNDNVDAAINRLKHAQRLAESFKKLDKQAFEDLMSDINDLYDDLTQYKKEADEQIKEQNKLDIEESLKQELEKKEQEEKFKKRFE